MIKICIVCGKEFESEHGTVTCSDYCHLENIRRNQYRHDLIRKGILKREKKKCPVCGKNFTCNRNNIVYCSKSCREDATKKRRRDYFATYYEKNREKIISNVKKNKKLKNK